jgi:hypothetical protein
VVHLDRTRRHARRHGGGARAASLPPVNLASVPMWGSGSAFCDSLNLNSYTHAFTDFVYAPAADEAPSAPGKAFLRVYWRAGLQLWDPVRNAWRANPPVTTWAVSNPMDDFAFWFSPSIPDGGVSMAPGTRAYGYTWVEMWWHYTATADESWSGTGGIWYKATGYLRQNGYGGTTSNGACWWA